jgi:hypothetical protein
MHEYFYWCAVENHSNEGSIFLPLLETATDRKIQYPAVDLSMIYGIDFKSLPWFARSSVCCFSMLWRSQITILVGENE